MCSPSRRTARIGATRPPTWSCLTFVGQHIATALTRARAIEETRQRNAELAVINEIGMGLAKQLDFAAIIDLVGDRIGEVFASDSVGIALYDAETKIVTFPYSIDRGTPVPVDPIELGPGLNSEVIRTAKPLRIGSAEELAAHNPINVPRFEGDDDQSSSWLGVPILASGRVLGAVNLEREEAHAFSDADERLLATLASSMGVALENARLFDETKRLLAETDQRNAELAVVNEIGTALARPARLRGDHRPRRRARPIDLRGPDRLHRPLRPRDQRDDASRTSSTRASASEASPIQLGPGLTSEVIETDGRCDIGTVDEINAHGRNHRRRRGRRSPGWVSRSCAGDDVIGVISVRAREAACVQRGR